MEINKIIKREIISLIVSVTLILIIFISVSFSSFFTVAESQESSISFGDLDMVFCKDVTCNSNYSNYGQTIGLQSEGGVSSPINIYPYPNNVEALENVTPYIFNIDNTGTLKMYVDIFLESDESFIPTDSYAEFNDASTTYADHIKVGIAKCNDGIPSTNNVIVQKYSSITDNRVLEDELINVGEDITYCMWVWLDETTPNTIQKSYFVANISADSKYLPEIPAWYELCDNNSTDLKCKIKSNNNIYSDAISSTYVSSSDGINFGVVNSPSNGQGLYSDFKYGDGKNAYFRGGTYCAYTDYLAETSNGSKCIAAGGTWDSSTYHCSLDDSSSFCESKGFTYYELNNNLTFGGYAWKIIRIDNEGNIRLLYNGTSTSSRGAESNIGSAPYNNQAISNNRSIGYMYGTIDNYDSTPIIGNSENDKNNISPSTNYCYSKTLLIDSETGTMSLESPTCSIFNNTFADGTYYTLWSTNANATTKTVMQKITTYVSSTSCKYKYVTAKVPSTGNEFDNDIDSNIKTKVDEWYNINLNTITSKLSDAGYCNDRSINEGTGLGNSGTTYNAFVLRYSSPNFICENSKRDLFTLSNNTKGNKKLTYPVGLINNDEATYGGFIRYYNDVGTYHSYLQNGVNYCSISPARIVNNNVVAFNTVLKATGSYNVNWVSNNCYIRPVVSLKPDTLYVSGNGSAATPYVVN